MGRRPPRVTSPGMRVLVVDDSTELRARLVALIRETAPESVVDEARDGGEALAAVEAAFPELIILDLQLPGRGGLEILASLKQAPRAPRVLILTNHATDPHRRECLARGADYFFDKSMEFEEVAHVLSELRPSSMPLWP